MRVLLDANLPRGLARLLAGHEVHSIHQRRWSDLDDGPLLDACAGEYAVFVTMDQSLRFQQNLHGRPLAVLVLRACSNRIQDLEPLVPALLASLLEGPPGQVTQVPTCDAAGQMVRFRRHRCSPVECVTPAGGRAPPKRRVGRAPAAPGAR